MTYRQLPPFETELQRMLEQLRHQLPSCVNCQHGVNMRNDLQPTREGPIQHWPTCGLDPERRQPPARIIAFGCPLFKGDIPF